eukprot:CAMPEP_0118880102 /NCGR_PEP_ID=MMETSP1163-20130328/19710_1 /TAXON_ID=124430 /ORGANISM="Phaeomonas parva, Strain CCMP2877" /LENGTH=34 /DNA_ID= /DNA_START= /DNA_END= /DNA_ORIENTATION=
MASSAARGGKFAGSMLLTLNVANPNPNPSPNPNN